MNLTEAIVSKIDVAKTSCCQRSEKIGSGNVRKITLVNSSIKKTSLVFKKSNCESQKNKHWIEITKGKKLSNLNSSTAFVCTLHKSRLLFISLGLLQPTVLGLLRATLLTLYWHSYDYVCFKLT